MTAQPVRLILQWPRNDKGLYIQPTLEQYKDPDLQRIEQHNRDRAAHEADYADEHTGNVRTVDPKGTYLCINCNQRDGLKCLLMKMNLLPGGKLDLDAGSCGKWEVICAGDAEMRLHRWSPVKLGYAISEKKRFGCLVCPLSEIAKMPDSLGRKRWCGQFYMRVFDNACCNDNAVRTIKIKYTQAAYA